MELNIQQKQATKCSLLLTKKHIQSKPLQIPILDSTLINQFSVSNLF